MKTPSEGRADRLDFVDALRGWAAFGVLVVHTSIWAAGDFPHWFRSILESGSRGVQLFYVVSAFTLFLSVARRKRGEASPIRNFFLRRFFRIAPMFYVALIINLAHRATQPHGLDGVSGWQVVATVLFLNGWSPAWINSIVTGQWSVAIEMMFYLTVPLLALWVKDLTRALWITLWAVVLSVGLNTFMATRAPSENADVWFIFLFYWLPSQAPIFGLGIVLYFQWLRVEKGEINPALAPFFYAAAIVLLFVAGHGGYRFLPGHFVFGIAFVLLALALALRPNRFWVNPVTRSVGLVSYSLYLTHPMTLHVASKALDWVYRRVGMAPSPLARYGLLLSLGGAVAYAFAVLCFWCIEKPGMEAGRRLIRRWETGAN